jgi:prepilin-type N-terminal cleavage/methylation domain-containing protein
MCHRRNHSSAGFTLVEILVVVVILGLVSAMILPQIGNRDDLRTSAAARIVMSDLIYAQNLSISRQQPHYMRFTSTGYGLYSVPTGGSPITHPVNLTPYTATFGAGGSSGLQSCSLVSSDFDGQLVLAFDELGAPYSWEAVNGLVPLVAAGQIRVGSGSYQLIISVEPFTGEVTVAIP